MKKIELKISRFWIYLAAQLLWLLAIPVINGLNMVLTSAISHTIVMLVGVIGYYSLYKKIFEVKDTVKETEKTEEKENPIDKVKDKNLSKTPIEQCGWWVAIGDDDLPITLVLPWPVIEAIKYQFKLEDNTRPLKVEQIDEFLKFNKVTVNSNQVGYVKKGLVPSKDFKELQKLFKEDSLIVKEEKEKENPLSETFERETKKFFSTKPTELKYRENGETFSKSVSDYFIIKSYKERFEKLLKENKYPSAESFNQWFKKFQPKEIVK